MQVGKVSTQANAGINVFRINQNYENQNVQTRRDREKNGERQDRVTISPQGRMANMLQSLMEQKDRVQEQRQELIHETIQSGKGLDAIEVQLDTFDQQLETIDTQMEQLMAAQLEQATKTDEPEKKPENQEPKTEDEARSEAVLRLGTISAGIETAQTVSQFQSKLESKADILRSEAYLKQVWIDEKESLMKFEPETGGIIESLKKEMRQTKRDANDLDLRAAEISGIVTELVDGVQDQLAENGERLAASSEQAPESSLQPENEQKQPAAPVAPEEQERE